MDFTAFASGLTQDMESLPDKQRSVLDAIIALINEQGYPPSIQQLCDYCGVRSTSTIHYHLSTLKKKGFVDWNPAEKRSISLHADLLTPKGQLPILGTIAAGEPLETVTDALEQLNLAEDLCPEGCYALRVKGDSMIEDHIMEGDIVIVNPKATVRQGDVAVALVDEDTATLKRIYREKNGVRLQPANSTMEPWIVTNVKIQGKVEAVIRKVT